ncbi:MAG TPA: hypothetical protein VJ801_11860 [Polyangia bacterium]|jgi:hypothetical protein|nr:hypothetical protein [Polyangia bacterium]
MTSKINLERLIAASRPKIMTPEEKELQRRSFAYGNANIENERVTRETIDSAAEAIAHDEQH